MNIAIVLSGGNGSRVGTLVPKQYIIIDDVPVIIHCLRALDESRYIDKIQIVAEEGWLPDIQSWCKDFQVEGKVAGFSQPGENRQLSIYHALEDIKKYAKDEDYVFVHDAARPFLTEDLIKRSIEGMEGYDGVIPVLPMKDTVYKSKDGNTIDSLLNRSEIYAGQAPETFMLGKYYEANKKLVESGEILKINGSTEPAILAGMKMHMIDGDENNFKITTKADLERFAETVKGNL